MLTKEQTREIREASVGAPTDRFRRWPEVFLRKDSLRKSFLQRRLERYGQPELESCDLPGALRPDTSAVSFDQTVYPENLIGTDSGFR
jgi:hypothetical protein